MRTTIRDLIRDLENSAADNLEKEVRFYHPEYCEEACDYFDYDSIESKQPNLITIILKD